MMGRDREGKGKEQDSIFQYPSYLRVIIGNIVIDLLCAAAAPSARKYISTTPYCLSHYSNPLQGGEEMLSSSPFFPERLWWCPATYACSLSSFHFIFRFYGNY